MKAITVNGKTITNECNVYEVCITDKRFDLDLVRGFDMISQASDYADKKEKSIKTTTGLNGSVIMELVNEAIEMRVEEKGLRIETEQYKIFVFVNAEVK